MHTKKITFLFIILFIFFLATRFYSYFINSVPLGYDSGLYLYLFKKYSQLPFFSYGALPDWLVQSFQPGLPVLVKIVSPLINPERLLIPLIILSQIMLFWAVYIFAKKIWNSTRAGLWSTIIFSLSAIQYRFYWYYYLKNAFSLSFVLFAFYFMLSSSYWAIPFVVLTLYFHQQTAAFLLIILLILILVRKEQRRYLITVLGISAASAAPYYLLTFKQSLMPLMPLILAGFVPQTMGGTLGNATGTFYNPFEALALALFYLPFGLWSLYKLKFKKNTLLATLPFLLSLIVVAFGFYLSHRFIPFVDLFLILLAGYGASDFFKNKKIVRFIYVFILIIFSSAFIYKTSEPLIMNDELNEIKMLKNTESNASVLVTDQAYMPWVYGWSDRKTIAPGFGENDIYWTIPEWHEFWESGSVEIQNNLLLKIPKPLYIYDGDRRQQALTNFSGECFERINWRTYRFICE